MKKILITVIIGMFLLSGFMVTSASKNEVICVLNGGNTLYVGGTGPGNYTNIQDAINDSLNGDTVYVYNGIYYENISVNKTITLIGEDRDFTIIDSSHIFGSAVVEIKEMGVNITGFMITGGSYGFDLSSSSNNIIRNCNILNNRWIGIDQDTSNNNTVIYCNISNSWIGVDSGNSCNNMFKHCNISNNSWAGIFLHGSYNMTISNCDFINDGIRISGCGPFNHIIENNTINGKNLLYYEDENNMVLDGVEFEAGQIILVNCSNFAIKNMKIEYTDMGIVILCCNNINISHCTISNNSDYGIKFELSNDNSVYNCKILDNEDYGIFLYNCNNGNKISNCNISNNYGGIAIHHSNNNDISSCKLLNNDGNSIDLENSNNNTIYNCKVSTDAFQGIDLDYSNNNSFCYCNISNTFYGIRLDYCNHNTFYHCNISNTTGNVIFLDNSNNYNIISYCTIMSIEKNGVVGNGIDLDDFNNNNIISHCNISDNFKGIELDHSNSNNNISYCNISNSYLSGVEIDEGHYNTVNHCNISNNGVGIKLDSSTFNTIHHCNVVNNNYSVILSVCYANRIYLNNFIKSKNKAISFQSANSWNSPKKITYKYKGKTYTNYLGNYWDDYTGSDKNSDGIGDTPYILDWSGGKEKDKYPFMIPFGSYDLDGAKIVIAPSDFSKISAFIKNIGNNILSDIEWEISVIGGLLGRINLFNNGTIESLDPGMSEEITTGFNSIVRRLGRVTVNVEVKSGEDTFLETFYGFVLGRLFVDRSYRILNP